MDDALGIDAKHVAIEREVMERAEREAVDDRGDPFRLDVGNDMRGLHEGALAERADRAAVAIGAHHLELEALLMQPDARLAGRVRAHLRPGHEATRLHLLDRQAGLDDRLGDPVSWSASLIRYAACSPSRLARSRPDLIARRTVLVLIC